MVEGYDLLVGGGAGARSGARPAGAQSVPFPELPPMVLSLLSAWMDQRDGEEDFQAWTARQATRSSPDRHPRESGDPGLWPKGDATVCHERHHSPAPADSRERAVLAGAARLAERLPGRSLRRRDAADVRRRRPRHAEPVEDFPWHDPVLELPERLALAEGRPLPQRLMAAMGQLDCGQCGYMCQTYAAALAEGRESSISLCVPGAKPTQLALKRLMAEAPVLPPTPRRMRPRPSRTRGARRLPPSRSPSLAPARTSAMSSSTCWTPA